MDYSVFPLEHTTCSGGTVLSYSLKLAQYNNDKILNRKRYGSLENLRVKTLIQSFLKKIKCIIVIITHARPFILKIDRILCKNK